MTIRLIPQTLCMAGEAEQLGEIQSRVEAAASGQTLLFPEYAAYTLEGGRRAAELLQTLARRHGVTIITSLNCAAPDLPEARTGVCYNTLVIFSRSGKVHAPQAKITPQSFEMEHLDAAFPQINVAPYSRLNRVRVQQNGHPGTVVFAICSDLYVLPLFGFEELQADALVCPANFGTGAERGARTLMRYAVASRLFARGFLCNSWQPKKPGRTPFTVAVEEVYEAPPSVQPFDLRRFREVVEQASVLYPDREYPSFKCMLKLTEHGTFTVPRSRSVEEGLRVQLGEYPETVDL